MSSRICVPRLPPGWVPPVARIQGGLFTVRQAVEAGATAHQVRRRRETGRWIRVAGDAFAAAGRPADPWTLAQAAALTWPDAVVCLSSAAQVHGFPVPSDLTVHVIVPNRRASRRGLVSHQMPLDAGDVLRTGMAWVTSPARTLFDCIGRLPTADSEALVAWAVTREVLSRPALERAVERRRGSLGNTRRRQALTDTRAGALSAAERALHRILVNSGLQGWAADRPVRDALGLIGRADVLFHHERLVLEVDGRAFHGSDRFQADRTRQNRLVAAGYTVLRFTWADLTLRPDDVGTQVAATLARLRVAAGGPTR